MFFNSKPDIKYFLYEIVHHCNLNCSWCDHCAPVATPEYVSLEQYQADINQMKNTFKTIKEIGIMGGEPLLHKDITEILLQTNNILKDTKILLFTNGILLKDENDEFWETVKNTKTIIVITKYGNTFNYKDIQEKIIKYKIHIAFMDNTDIQDKPFNKIAYNLNGTEDINASHKNCYHAKHCPQLENGILYKCTIVPAARHFNEYFKKNLEISEKDGINIYKMQSKKEIEQYFKNPIPFCRYCDVSARIKTKKWEISSKNIEEWT